MSDSEAPRNAPTEPPASQPPHEYRVFIRESHLDTFGHVNNATYLQLFEEARWDLITARGFGLEDIQRKRIGPVILEANVKFRREVRNRETLTIHSFLLDYEGKIGRMSQRALKDDGELCCDAIFVIGLWDIDARKLLLPTEDWKQAIGVV
jgi:YbgC/YbaW family acyl-CoA thioester hydrolase